MEQHSNNAIVFNKISNWKEIIPFEIFPLGSITASYLKGGIMKLRKLMWVDIFNVLLKKMKYSFHHYFVLR